MNSYMNPWVASLMVGRMYHGPSEIAAPRALRGTRNERICRGRHVHVHLGSAWEERISLSLSLMLARLEIRNLITAIVIDLGEIRDINCDNLCILTQSGSKREGNAGRRKKSTMERSPRKFSG